MSNSAGIRHVMNRAESRNDMLAEFQVRPVERNKEVRYQKQLAHPHYLGELVKIGETVWYVATLYAIDYYG